MRGVVLVQGVGGGVRWSVCVWQASVVLFKRERVSPIVSQLNNRSEVQEEGELVE